MMRHASVLQLAMGKLSNASAILLPDFDQTRPRSRILMIWVYFVSAPLDRRGAARRPVDGPVFPSWPICRGILGGPTRPEGGVLAPPRGGGR